MLARPVLAQQKPLTPCVRRVRPSLDSFESGFELEFGDTSTIPQAEAIDIKSLTSGKVIGCVHISATKNTPLEERIIFKDRWYVGAEHGLQHDGMQADGSLECRIDWKVVDSHEERSAFCILKVNPWLTYGCGEGARLMLRKPGASEGTACTVQRILRDDSVVVRRDGTDQDLTVDPTPFSVVTAANVRHRAGTRLLVVHENASVDGVVEPWPANEIEFKEGTRHVLALQGRTLSGWVPVVVSKDHIAVLKRTRAEGEAEERPGLQVAVTSPAAPATAPPAGSDDERFCPDAGQLFTIAVKAVSVRMGCGVATEKIGTMKGGTPVRLLERRETELHGAWAYISTIPGEVVRMTIALNEFNHSVQRFPTAAEYEAARANYLEDIVEKESLVEDAITGKKISYLYSLV